MMSQFRLSLVKLKRNQATSLQEKSLKKANLFANSMAAIAVL